MDYHDIPEYDELDVWWTAQDTYEVKLLKNDKVVLHLYEDSEESAEQIEDGRFYIPNGCLCLTWIRERKGIEMADGIVDADYVEISDAKMREYQHNHLHLDRDVQDGELIPLKVA
jgi:hypothetical protein